MRRLLAKLRSALLEPTLVGSTRRVKLQVLWGVLFRIVVWEGMLDCSSFQGRRPDPTEMFEVFCESVRGAVRLRWLSGLRELWVIIYQGNEVVVLYRLPNAMGLVICILDYLFPKVEEDIQRREDHA